MIQFACSHCSSKLKVKSDAGGKNLRCPRCSRVVAIPVSADDTISAANTPSPSPSSSAITTSLTLHLEGEIARGGMGAVLRAVDPEIRREIAVKFLLNQADVNQRARFVEEAQITGQLEHPNIVPIHQLGTNADGRCFFTMKMVKGRTLGDLLKEHAKDQASHPLSKLLGIFLGICNAIRYAHSQQVIHRDLKPANIMIGDFGEVYVMDWGLAKVLGREEIIAPTAPAEVSSASISHVRTSRTQDAGLTQAGAIVGTPAYMPPEQARGDADAIDERSDIYSLGAILYEILTLTPPVGRGGDAFAVLMRVVEGEIDPPATRAPERARSGWAPPELAAVAMKALAKKPTDRYRSVDELKHDIERFLEGRSVSAKADSTWEMLRKLVKRNKAVTAVAGAALLGLFTSFVFILISWRETGAAYQKYEDEQRDKTARMKKSAPAFVRAAELMMNERQFDDALAQVEAALEYDPAQTDALLVKGQLLIILERYAEAVEPLSTYVDRKPANAAAKTLRDLARNPSPDRAEYFWSLYTVFETQKNRPAFERMAQLAERFVGPQKDLINAYRKRIDAAPGWVGLGARLRLSKDGEIHLSLAREKVVSDLTPLRGMKLSALDLSQTPVKDLTPLQGMPLKSLELGGIPTIKDLTPLRGMNLKVLKINGMSEITTLEPLRGMPLDTLNISFCNKVSDLDPLRGMPLTRLYCDGYGLMKISNLEPLTGMKLTHLGLRLAHQVKDIAPLKDMPLEFLDMDRLKEVRDFEPLRGRPLAHLNLDGTRFKDLTLLKGMPLEWLNISNCTEIKDLTPIADARLKTLFMNGLPVTSLEPIQRMPLETLHLGGCKNLETLDLVQNLPLKTLAINGCPKINDLSPLRGLKLSQLSIQGSEKIDDLTPLADIELKGITLTPHLIRKGMDTLRAMKTLDVISLGPDRGLSREEFFRRYDKGEFAK